MKEETERKNKNLYVTFRIFQAIFLGIFALGISSGIGDFFKFVELPIGTFSVTTTIFGLIGAIMTGSLAKQSEKW
jgi:hypothetical protein